MSTTPKVAKNYFFMRLICHIRHAISQSSVVKRVSGVTDSVTDV